MLQPEQIITVFVKICKQSYIIYLFLLKIEQIKHFSLFFLAGINIIT